MKTVSIIIPAYNSQNSIESCVNSAINQTYKNIEVIVVDDGSTDDTYQILSRIKEKYSRLKLIRQENGGVSAARNTAIQNATGDYIAFLDSDDTLTENAVEDMLSLADENTDLVICSYNQLEMKGKKVKKNTPRIYNNPQELLDDFIEYDKDIWGIWNKLFRRDIIVDNNILYSTNFSYGEDHIFNLAYTKYIKNKVVVSDKIVYNYYMQGGTHSKSGGAHSRYYDNMHIIRRAFYSKISDLFSEIPREYEVHYIRKYIISTLDFYLIWLLPKKSAVMAEKTFQAFSDVINDDILSATFTPKQCNLIKSSDMTAFVLNYMLRNPKKTIWRKIKMHIRFILEPIEIKLFARIKN